MFTTPPKQTIRVRTVVDDMVLNENFFSAAADDRNINIVGDEASIAAALEAVKQFRRQNKPRFSAQLLLFVARATNVITHVMLVEDLGRAVEEDEERLEEYYLGPARRVREIISMRS